MNKTNRPTIKRIAAVAFAALFTVVSYAGCADDMDGGYPYSGGQKADYADNRTNEANSRAEAAQKDEWEQQFLTPDTQKPEPDEVPAGEEYNAITENSFQSPLSTPLSTFSVDVDTACYSNLRRLIENGSKVPTEAVRIEEMLNYFKYDYTTPDKGEGIAPTLELSDCPWNPNTKLMLVGLQTEQPEQKPDSNLVFLIDVSGSMNDSNKLPLVKQCFGILTGQLGKYDTVSIVTYSGREEVVLEGARGNETEKIMSAVNRLTASGSTAGAAGIQTAYQIAQRYFITGGCNRVILATDGDLNVGISSEAELTKLIEDKRETGVYLSVLGFGMGNYSDARLEALADQGNGNYSYIDTLNEGGRVLGATLESTLYTAAKDVKIQVEFNPATVKGYRLIGYENRALSAQDFQNDKVDAGEMGANSQVTALYEVALADSPEEVTVDSGLALEYQTTAAKNTENVATLHLRYKLPDAAESKEYAYPVALAAYQKQMSDSLRFASSVAAFGLVLRDSKYKGTATYNSILDDLTETVTLRNDPDKLDFETLVHDAYRLYS